MLHFQRDILEEIEDRINKITPQIIVNMYIFNNSKKFSIWMNDILQTSATKRGDKPVGLRYVKSRRV